ncbi:MAG TPA: Crp/Fnr family transcriptional regulator [Burkholderiales bacterium]|nr:Crp/Fnr family transcriptional regulator [Burkholderiales bacterium]
MLAKLKTISLFAGLSDDEIRLLESHSFTKTFPKNTVLVTEDDHTDSFYVILSGKVKIYVSDQAGKEVVLGTYGAGDYFGEMVLDEGPRSASVMTLEPSSFAIISKAEINTLIERHPEMAIHIMKKVIQRARILTENVKSLALLDVYGRVARLLLSLATDLNGELVIAENLTHQDLANRVGASREMISRILKDLSLGGYITVEGRKIIINKKPPSGW